MHVIISQQQVIFTGLISFYKFFNDMRFTHVIFLLGSNVGRYPKMKSEYHRTTPCKKAGRVKRLRRCRKMPLR